MRTLFHSGHAGMMNLTARWTAKRLRSLQDSLTRIRVLHGSDLAELLEAMLGDHARSCAAIDAAAELQKRVEWLESVVETQMLRLGALEAERVSFEDGMEAIPEVDMLEWNPLGRIVDRRA
jgi:hypothetical protein